MKITSSLLKKYTSGQCTPQEVKLVEDWLSTSEDDAVLSPQEIGDSPKVIRDNLYTSLFNAGDNSASLPLYSKLSRYAAAACVIFAAFFGGRFSANTANATMAVDPHPKDHLYISGGNGSQGNLSGKVFKVSFDGSLRLYNGSMNPKSIQVGDTAFVLEARHYYYLQGSVNKPSLIKETYSTYDFGDTFKPEGYFSILRLDTK